MNEALTHTLERRIVINAKRATVFRYFTDSKRFADWWGAGSEIEGKSGGKMRICYPGGIKVSGEVREIVPQQRIVFTYGYDSGIPIPPGSSLVTITLKDHPDGTELTLVHAFSDPAVRNEHIQGWRYQLALFANVASKDQHQNLQQLIDQYFQLWNTTAADQRRNAMQEILTPDVEFHDPYGCTSGVEEFDIHIAAVHRFMPGMSIARNGSAQLCQGAALSNWVAKGADGATAASGTNVFTLSPDGLIRKIYGFWM